MKKVYLFIITLLVAFFSVNDAKASHAAGDDSPSITCNGNGTYTIRWIFYRDCNGISAPTSPIVTIVSSCGGSTTATLTRNTVTYPTVVVPGLCSPSLATCNNGAFPGFEIHIYEATVTLAPGCTYTISHSEGSRNPSTNYTNADFSDLYSETQYTTSSSFCNNTPQFFNYPIPYVCQGQSFTYNQGALDLDGDSLVYSSIVPMSGAGTSLPNPINGASAANPFGTNGTFSLNPNTGQMTILCNVAGSYAFTLKIDEYRNGVKIGSIMRNIQIQVVPCGANIPPTNTGQPISIAGADTTGFSSTGIIGVCPGQSVSFTVNVADPNGDSLRWTSTNTTTIPGSVLTATRVNNKKDSLLFSFTWTPAVTDSGYKNFVINVNDGACPVLGTQSFSYTFRIIAGTYAGPDRSYCIEGGPMTVSVRGGSDFSWEILGGGAPVGIISSTPDSGVVVFAPAVTTTYVVTSDLAGGCKNKDTITIYNVPGFEVDITSPDTNICLNATANLTANLSNSTFTPYTIIWNTGDAVKDTTIISKNSFTTAVKPFTTIDYIATVTSNTGCTVRDTQRVVINGVGPMVKIVADKNYVCPGTTINLNPIVSAVQCGLTPGGLANACSNLDPVTPYTVDTVGVMSGGSTTVTPFRGFWHDGRVQYLFRASELQALGMKAGTMTGLVFWISTKSSTAPYNDFTIKMGCTSLTQLPSTYVAGLSTVLNPISYNSFLGANAFSLDNPYDWDGFSNLIVEICFDNAAYTQYDAVLTSTAFAGATLHRNVDGSTGCSLTTPTSSNLRPTTRFEMCLPAISNYAYEWTPTTGVSCDTCLNTAVTLAADQAYSLKVTDLTTGCDGGDAINLFIDAAVKMNVTPQDTAICGTNDTILLKAERVNPISPACQQSYSQTSIPYNALSGTPTNVTWTTGDGDEDYSTVINIPFTFKYFCTDYTQLRVSTNGFIALGNNTANVPTFTYGQTIPTNTAPNNLIALCWDDLDQNSGGTVSYFTSGTAPNRVFVIKWTNVPHYSSTTVVSGEIHLNETTNFVEIHTLLQDDNGAHTQGLENAAGNAAAPVIGRNNVSWTVTTPDAWLFTPNYSGSLPLSYSWTPVAPATGTQANIATPFDSSSLAAPTDAMQIAFAVTFSSGCIVRDTVNISKSTFPYTLTATPSQICPSDSSSLLIATSGPSPIATVNWTPAVYLNNSTIANPTATVINDTKFYVTATNAAGCRAIDSITVTTFKRDSLHLSVRDTTVCPGSSVSVSINDPSAPFAKVHWYAINPTYTLVDTNNLNTIVFSQANSYQARIWENGCSYLSDTVTIRNFTDPLFKARADSSCPGGLATFTALTTGLSNYVWSDNQSGSSIQSNTNGYLYYTAMDINGCTWQSDSVRTDRYPAPSYSASADTVCPGQKATFTALTTGLSNYVWNSGQSGSSIQSDTTAYLFYTATDIHGCTWKSDSVKSGLRTNPGLRAYNDTTICAGDQALLTSDAGYSNYVWSTTQTTPTITVSTAGSYYYQANDRYGCRWTSDTAIVAITNVPVISFASVKNPKCPGESVVLNAGSQAGVAYNWNPGGTGNTITVTSPATYNVTATVGSCSATGSIIITESTSPTVTLPANQSHCICDTSITVTPTVNAPFPGAVTYNWSNSTAAPTASVSNTNTLTLTVTDANGCTAVSNATTVSINCLKVSAGYVNGTTITPGNTVELTVDTLYVNGTYLTSPYPSSYTYSWTPTAAVQYPSQSSTGVNPDSTTQFTLLITDPSTGCQADDTITVYVVNNLVYRFPTAFTPNGDGKNDTYYPVTNDPNAQILSFNIYNQWNQLVYSQVSPWDGNYMNTTVAQPIGVYIYYVSFRKPDPNNPSQMITDNVMGTFTLIR